MSTAAPQVACPICQRRVPKELISNHAAACGLEQEEEEWTTAAPPAKRKAKKKRSKTKNTDSSAHGPSLDEARDGMGAFSTLLNPAYAEGHSRFRTNKQRIDSEHSASPSDLPKRGPDNPTENSSDRSASDDDADATATLLRVKVRRMSTEHGILKSARSTSKTMTAHHVHFDDHTHTFRYNPNKKLKLHIPVPHTEPQPVLGANQAAAMLVQPSSSTLTLPTRTATPLQQVTMEPYETLQNGALLSFVLALVMTFYHSLIV
eukprot:m.49707 g.49707  ORF g.49707 m.49707 type:complete len:262 (+) comp13364_c0_seq1:66-851(+)